MDRPIRIRLAGIAARETDGSCRRWQPCPPASAEAATGALVDLLGGRQGERSTGHVLVSGPQLRCRSDGPARGDRTAAWCELPDGRDLSCAMVGTGTVAIWPRFWGDHSCSRPDR
jgi:endonuclease YncB( thermonuclease family)